MRAIILSIGDELVLGQTVDTNSAWISRELAAVGCSVSAHLTVPDDQPLIEGAMRESVERCDWLIVSGGIGPTEDDLTRQALAAVLDQPLEPDADWLIRLDEFFRSRGRQMPPSNRVQAMVPRGAVAIPNPVGTALAIQASWESAATGANCRIFVLPGVPKEMKRLFETVVLPAVRLVSRGAVILSRTLHTFGLGESAIAERIPELMQRGRNPSVGTTVSGGVVSLRLNSRFESREEAERRLDETDRDCRAALGELIYGQDDQTLQEVVGKLLRERNGGVTVTTAESCTGGLVAKMLTDPSGSSAYFKHGWVTYANEAKSGLLEVPESTLEEHGAVSEPVVRAMASAARRKAGATYALAISGIAGPGGGTVDKPVGTTWICLAKPDDILARRYSFPGDREMVRDRAAKMALTMLRFELLGHRWTL